MNRLKNQRAYLCGAMDRAKDGGVGWREEVALFIRGIDGIVLNPCEKEKLLGFAIEDLEDRSLRREWKETGQWDKLAECKIIRNVDLRMVDISDYLIVYLDMECNPFGTIEEISLANRQKKPVLIWAEGGKKHAPDWLFWMLPHYYIFDDKDSLMTYINNVDSGELDPDDDRWVFFNLS